MTNTKKHTLTIEEVRWINSLAVPCATCEGMHWDAYRTGRCAGCSTLDEMQVALDAGWCR
jgi:hypothetical protein